MPHAKQNYDQSIISKGKRVVMEVTAYTANDEGMDGRGITASGEKVQEGVTIAADPSIPFGTQIYIPYFDNTFTVQDRGRAIRGNKLDVYFERKEDALKFGRRTLEVWILD